MGIAFFEEICPNGEKTLSYLSNEGKKIYLHSRYDPVGEARSFAGAQKVKNGDDIVVYGFGMGYHLEALIGLIGQNGTLTVLESNSDVLEIAMKSRNLNKLLGADNFRLIHRDLADEFIAEMYGEISSFILNGGQFIIHRPSLGLIPAQLTKLKELLTQWKALSASTYKEEILIKNFFNNKPFWSNEPSVEMLYNMFPGKPVMLISAGPSLDENLPELKKIRSNAVVVSVGTALRPLMQFGIEPDFVIITDPSPKVYKQIEGLDCRFPLIALPTTHPDVIRNYPGPRIFAFQEGIEQVEEQARLLGYSLINTGGSVATTGLEVVLKMGGNPVILVGQDLAYCHNRSHVRDSIHDLGEMAIVNGIVTISNNGEQVPTSVSWNIYRRWLEKRIEREGEARQIINTSLNGARIEGTVVMSLHEVIKKFIG